MAKFRKQIYKQTRAVASTHGLSIGRSEYEQMVRNFRKGNVWIPYTHSADPRDNVGFVADLFYNEKDNSLYATMEIVEEEAIERVKSKLVKDVSVSLYEDEEKGFILEHVALTMNPGFKPQKPFVELERKGKTIEVQQDDLVGFTQLEEVVVNTETEQEVIVVDNEIEAVVDEEETTVDTPEDTVDLEEAKGFFKKIVSSFGKDEKVKKIELENKSLVTELEASTTKVTELEAILVEAKEAVTLLEEDKRVTRWNLVFDKYLGTKVTPVEKELLFERVLDPEELKIELEARADLGLTEKVIELENKAADDGLAQLSDDERKLVKKYGWDKEGNEKYLEHFLQNVSKEEENN